MVTVGNWSKLQLSPVQLTASNARMNLGRAEQAAAQAQAKLVKTMGQTGLQDRFVLPDQLPAVPAQPMAAAELQKRAEAVRNQLPDTEGTQPAPINLKLPLRRPKSLRSETSSGQSAGAIKTPCEKPLGAALGRAVRSVGHMKQRGNALTVDPQTRVNRIAPCTFMFSVFVALSWVAWPLWRARRATA